MRKYISGLMLIAGCQSLDKSVRFGDYSMSIETYDYIVNFSHEDRGYIPNYKDFMQLGEEGDGNGDGYITKEEFDGFMEGLAAAAAAAKGGR